MIASCEPQRRGTDGHGRLVLARVLPPFRMLRLDEATMPELELWDDPRLVKAIRDAHSLNGAAKILGLNHSTVFRRLVALEDTLGVRLFERGRAGYSSTDAGAEMAALADRMAQDITEFERHVAGRDIEATGKLRVTTTDTILAHLLTPILAGFRTLHAGISLDIIVGNESLNLSRRDADIAIRATDRPPESLVGRCVAGIAWAKYGPAAATNGNDSSEPGVWVGNETHCRRQRRCADYTIQCPRIRSSKRQYGNGRCGSHCRRNRLRLPTNLSGRSRAGNRPNGRRHPRFCRQPLASHASGLRHAPRVRVFMDYVGGALPKQCKCIEGN